MGFGKTTVARKLAVQYNAVILNDDEFMCELFGRNLPEKQFREAHEKVSQFTWKLAERIICAGTNVILVKQMTAGGALIIRTFNFNNSRR